MKFAYKNLLSFLLVVFVFSFFFMPGVSLAACPPDCPDQTSNPSDPAASVPAPKQTIDNPLDGKIDNLNGFIKILLEGVIKIGIPLIAIALVYSGYLFVTAAGNPQKIEKAKDAFVYALIGGAILLGSWAIAQMISDTVLQIN
ncbi:MAG: pilin [Candidatus Paceibacterota bacterium]